MYLVVAPNELYITIMTGFVTGPISPSLHADDFRFLGRRAGRAMIGLHWSSLDSRAGGSDGWEERVLLVGAVGRIRGNSADRSGRGMRHRRWWEVEGWRNVVQGKVWSFQRKVQLESVSVKWANRTRRDREQWDNEQSSRDHQRVNDGQRLGRVASAG
jgi:hypothetical protein